MSKIIKSPTSKKLYHLAKRNVICAKKLQKFYKDLPDASHRLGALPFDWLSEVDVSERANVTRAVFDCFESFAQRTKDIDDVVLPSRKEHMNFSARGLAFLSEYSSLKRDLSKILKRDDIDIDYAGSGVFKACARLKVGMYDYALSTFKDRGCFGEYKDYFIFTHGRGMEPQHVFINYKRSSQGRFARPFMSKACSKNEFDGFILSKFIDRTKTKWKKESIFAQSRNYFVNADPDNSCNGVAFESGGRFRNPAYIENVHVRNTWSRFANILDGNIEDLKRKRWVRPVVVQEFLLENAKSGVDICSESFKSNYRKKLIPYYLKDEAQIPSRYSFNERMLMLALSCVPVDSKAYNFLLDNVATHMSAGSGIRFGFKNFSEVLKNMLKLVNRKATKQIRAVKKVRALKNELSAKGEYVKYRSMLSADVNRLFLNSNNLSMAYPKYYPELLDYELGLNKAEAVYRERDF